MADTTIPETSSATPNDAVLTPPDSSRPTFATPVMEPQGTNVTLRPQFQTRNATAVRRTSPIPRNTEGHFYCAHEDCEGNDVTFRRVCEWNKHMDKHERPYKCSHPNCANAQGFTYSGGLMRHQREVHRWHQTSKSRLYCPYPRCERGPDGDGFSRKENLEEHKRRRHCEQPYDHVVTDDDADDSANDHQSGRKRQRRDGPQQSQDSPQVDLPAPEQDPPVSEDAANGANVDEGSVAKSLRDQLQVAHLEIQRLANENAGLRGQVNHMYTLFANRPAQVYHLNPSPAYLGQAQIADYASAYGNMAPNNPQ